MADTTITILNADDNAARLAANSQVLQQAGFTVIEATTGPDVLRQVAADRPVLVLLALTRSELSGREICRRLKNDPTTATTLVLQISAASGDISDREQDLEIGADGYLVAPVAPMELLATVRALVRLWQREEENRRLCAQLQQETVKRAVARIRYQQTEEVLRRSERMFRRLAETNLVGVGFGDSQGHISYVNDEMLRMMGYTRADYEAGGSKWTDCITPEFRDDCALG